MFYKKKKNPELNHQEIAVAFGYSTVACAAFDLITPREENEPPQMRTQIFALDDQDLAGSIAEWANTLQIKCDFDTPYLLNCKQYHESTKLLALDDDALAMSDDELPLYLIASVNSNSPGADGKPILGANVDFELNSYSIFRVENNQVALTKIPRLDLTQAIERIIDFSAIDTDLDASLAPSINLQIETPARAVARFYFDTVADVRSHDNNSATAFLLITPKGYQLALYSPYSADVIVEIAELFQKDEEESNGFFSTQTPETAGNVDDDQAAKIKHAISELQTQFKDLSQYGLQDLSKMVWVASAEMEPAFYEVLSEADTVLNFRAIPLDITYEEAVACGLLLSANDLTDIQPVNLMRDLTALSTEAETESLNEQAQHETQRRSYAALVLIAPFLLIVSISVALFLNTYRTSSALTEREEIAASGKKELEPTLKLWNSYNERYKFYADYTKQIIDLRTSQGRAITLFSELDSRYPLALDSAFWVSELKLSADGSLEIKGMGRDEAAFTNFFRSLESSKIVIKDKYAKTFNALTFDLQQGAAKSPLDTSAQTVAPGVIVWNIKGIYAPLVAPPAESAQPSGTSPAGSQLAPATGLKPNQKIQSGV